MQKDLAKIISIFENHYTQRKSFLTLHQTSNDDFTYEETNLIFNNPNIFFAASKSRIILVHWICKYVREIFEKYEFADIEIPTESYEIIRSKFDTKAFNRNEFCRLFNCEKKSLLSYDEFIELEQFYINEYNKVVSEENRLSSITHISIKKIQQKPNISKEFLDIIKDEKTKKILNLRNSGFTLDEVGTEMKLTRERVRQIEGKPKMLIARWMNANIKEIKENFCNNNILDEKKILKILTNEGLNILKYSLKTLNEKSNWYYLESLNIVICDETNNFIDYLNELITKYKNKEFKLQEDFINVLNNNGYTFFDTELATKYLKANNFNVFENDVYYGKMTIAKAVILAAQINPAGYVKITDKKSLSDFANLINENYGLNIKPDRALSTRIQDILVMVGKASYSSPDTINISKDVIEEICKYINNMKNERISYSALYEVFKDKLKKSSINNHYALHGALKHYEAENNYLCLRYYICKKEITDIQSKSYFEKLPLLLKKNGPMNSDAIKTEIPEWNDMYIKYAMVYYPQVIRWDDDLFVNLDTINITAKEKEELVSIVDESINNKYKYTSSYIIFEKANKTLSDFMFRNKIINEKQLFYLVQYYLSDKYKFRKPHIINSNKVKESFTTDDLVKLIAGRAKIVDKKELIEELIKYYGYKNSSLSLSLQRVLADYIRVGKNFYIAKTRIKISDNDKDNIIRILNEGLIKDTVIIPENFDYSKLPDLGFKWNSWSLCGIINQFDLGFKKVIPALNVSNHTATPIVRNDSKLETKEDVARWLIENDFEGEKTKENISRYFRTMEFFNPLMITDEFIDSLN